MSARRARWQPPPPPTPRILHLPRRSSRRSRIATATRRHPPPPPPLPPSRSPPPEYVGNTCGSLEELFDQDRSFSGDRRAQVVSRSRTPPSPGPPRGGAGNRGDSERWRLEAEVLRAECSFLRMEREVALQKLESNRGQMEAVLGSAVQTLVSGRKKIDGEQGMGAVLQEEIAELQSKLELLHRSRRQRSSRRCASDDLKPRGKSTSGRNFDRKALLLRRRLEEMTVKVTKTTSYEEEEETCVREIREIASEGISISSEREKRRNYENVEAEKWDGLVPDWRCRFHDVEVLRRKMEGTSKVMLQRMEDYRSRLSSSSSFSSSSGDATTATATSLRAHRPRAAGTQKAAAEDVVEDGNGFCSGRCREVVGRIVEQVRAEAEQWNEMQGMLEQVQREMEDLQCSRDLWERVAVASDAKVRAANAQLLEWRQRAEASEHRVSELQTQVREFQVDLELLRRDLYHHLQLIPSSAPTAISSPSPSLSTLPVHTCSLNPPRRIKCQNSPPLTQPQPQPQQQLLLHKEKENRVRVCHAKENQPPPPGSRRPRRAPLQAIATCPPPRIVCDRLHHQAPQIPCARSTAPIHTRQSPC